MKPTHQNYISRQCGRSWAALLAIATGLATQAYPQAVPAAPQPAPVEKKDPVVPVKESPKEDDLVVLSPFEVSTDKDDGFMATNAGTATKLGMDMKDMAAPYSVMTGEFIKAMGITDLRDAVMWSTNGAPVLDGQGADLFGGGGTVTPSTMYNVRGFVINAGQQRNFFLTAGLSDTYNVERIDFGRGPNAVLFNVGANEALGGGISTQGKRANFSRNAATVELKAGSWDYYRSTLDVNQILLPGKLALRANLLYQNKNGYLQNEFEDRRGITLGGTYRMTKKSELRLEVIHDKTERSAVPIPMFDNLSGWNGSTTFNGPITNNTINGLVPTANGTLLTTTLGGQGGPEGVWREGGNVYIYDPLTNSVMNWLHTGSTRRGDENPNVPIYIDGQMWSRNGNGFLLPFGNSGGSGGNSRTPARDANGGAAPFSYAVGLPSDRFSRQVANSTFRVPGKRFTVVPEDPLFTQRTKDINFGFTHQFSDTLFLEVTGDANRVTEEQVASHLGFRVGFIDINQTLPNGSPNPHFRDAYSQSDATMNYRTLDNFGVRANLGYIKDLGKWGHYSFSLGVGYTGRDVEYRRKTLSLTLATDPREWHAGGQQVRLRYYWNDSVRPFLNVAPVSLFDRTVVAGVGGADNTYTTSTRTVQPRWVLGDWSDRKERTQSSIFAFAARYFDSKLIISPGVRIDQQMTAVRLRPTSWGFLPNDPNWDGVTLSDGYWRPDAPADWLTLSYIPKNNNGTPRATVPTLATGNRPTLGGVNDVNPANPVYVNDRFRGDYNPPEFNKTVVNTNLGVTYHALKWASLKLSYGDSYKPADNGRLILNGEEAKPEKGLAYEAGITFSFLKDRVSLTPRYYFNRKENVLGTPPTTGAINNLMNRNAWTDPSPDSRNPFNYSEVLGGDYAAVKNDGIELELVGRITKNWRVMGNFGTGQRVDYDRWKNTQGYVRSRQEEFLDVLEAAGGILDTSGAFNNLKSRSAPGWAIANPAVTPAMILAAGHSNTSERDNAVNDYNNIWAQYDNISALQDTIGIKRMKINFFTDYTFSTGRLKGLRVGGGWQYVDKDIAGYRSGDTIANPNYNPALPVSASNLTYIDDPSVDANTPIWVKRPSDFYLNLGYTMRLRSGYRPIDGKELSFQLNIRNLLNKQGVYYQDDGVVPRPPGGDLSQPYHVSVPGRIASFQRPINFEFTMTLKL